MLTSLSSPEAYRALLDSMTEGVSLSDEAGTIVYTNAAEDALFGYCRGELIGQHVSVQNAYQHNENIERVEEVIAHLKTHGSWHGEWHNRRKDGSTFITASRITSVAIDRATYWLCVQRDITGEREAEIRLRESEERLRLAAASASIGTWDFDARTGRGEWDGMALGIGGMKSRSYDAETWSALVHVDDRDRVRAAFESSLAPGGPTYQVEFRGAEPAEDGGVRWLASHGAVVRDPATGAPIRAIGIVRDISVERRAVAALQESEARFRAIVNAVPSLVWFAGPHGELQYFNDRWYAFTGQSPDQALGGGWVSVLHPDDAARTERAWAEARASERNYEIDCRYRGKDGSYRWHVARAEPMRDRDGRIVRWFGTSTDVHEQRQAIERLELALNSGAIQGTWVWDVSADRVTADERFAHTFGIDPEDCRTGFPIERAVAAIHEEDRPAVSEAIDRALAEGGAYRVEYRARNFAGVYRWVEASGQVELGADGSPTCFAGVAVDIEDRRAIEGERDRATSLLRAFFETLPGAAYAKDREGRVLLGNPGFSAAIGHPPESFLGKTDVELLSDKGQASEIMANDRQVMESGETQQIEEDLLLPDGRLTNWLSIKTPLRDPNGTVAGLVGISLEMTERRQAEERMRLLAREVDHRAKNLLGVMQSVIQLTRADDVGSFKSAVSGRIQALARAHSLLADSRWVGVSIDKLVREELAPFSKEGLDRIRIVGTPLRLRPAGSQALALVLHELATNAAKYGSLSIDTGAVDFAWGLKGDAPDRALEIVWREHGGPEVSAPSRKGFGSTVLRASVERQLAGRLELDWAPEGLVCRMRVPAEQLADRSDEPVVAAPKAPARPPEGKLDGRRVLLVEDEALIALRLEEMVRSLGCEVVGPASSVQGALFLIKERAPDLAVLDVNLSGRTSEPIAQALRALGIPFVFCTGYAGPIEPTPSFLGVPVLGKPIDPAELTDALRSLQAEANMQQIDAAEIVKSAG